MPVPVDEHGMLVGELARSQAQAALLTPAHQFPTGVVLAPQRRRGLLDWAAAADGLIVEDDYDAEFRYDRAPVPRAARLGPRAGTRGLRRQHLQDASPRHAAGLGFYRLFGSGPS